ncbi:ABC transporter permease [Micromonosporaceae bacterium Da 78-11]
MSTDRRHGTSIVDVLLQAAQAVRGRRGRSLLTASGIALGITAAVATVGISASAGGAISERFDAVKATTVTGRYAVTAARPDGTVADKVSKINGVATNGLFCVAENEEPLSGTSSRVARDAAERVAVASAQMGALKALRVEMVSGRHFDEGHEIRGDRVVLIDTVAARAMSMETLRPDTVLFLADTKYVVIGIYQAAPGEARLTNAAVVPYRACQDKWLPFGETTLVARTALGASDVVAAALPLALAPESPDAVTIEVPADLRSFRSGVENETQALFLGLAAVSLVIGALGVSNTTLVSVLERRSEIGLRRAVGASRLAVAGQFLVESALLGAAGGLMGTFLGVNVITVVTLVRGWIFVLDPWVLIAGPVGGLLVGMLAGAYPAFAAARVAPAATLRA